MNDYPLTDDGSMLLESGGSGAQKDAGMLWVML